TPHRDLVRAIQALAVVKETRAVQRLRELTLSIREPGPIRLEAARALASLRAEGAEKDAARLAADTSAKGVVSRVAGATLLSGHRGDEAVTLLGQLARDKEPSVAVIAVGGLLQIDVKLLLKLVGSLRDSSDARLRGFAVEVFRREPSEEYVHLLGDLLDDPHPTVRARAREALLQLAKKQQFAKQVIAEGTRMLATNEC